MKRLCASIGIIALADCGAADSVAPRATVSFVIDAPLCSFSMPVQFSIDSVPVGVDTFRVNLAAPHTASVGYATTAGTHVLGARTSAGYMWPDLRVTVVAGAAVKDTLPFYCS